MMRMINKQTGSGIYDSETGEDIGKILEPDRTEQGHEWCTKLYKVQSRSDPGIEHTVSYHNNLETNEIFVECDCKGYQYNHKCWHIEKIRNELKIETKIIHRRPKNYSFLNDKEYYRKRANIVEELKDCEIKLVYTDQTNFVAPDKPNNQYVHKNSGRKYIINIQTPADPCVPKKTAVYHELSHLLWDSFMSESFTILRKWAKDKAADLFYQNQTLIYNKEKKMASIKGMPNTPYHIQKVMSQTQAEIEKHIASIYISCFNSLEDQRIESLTQEVWLATGGMFDKSRTNCGKEMSADSMGTPSNHLLAARFNRPELTTDEYRKAVRDVESTGKKGAIVVMQQIKGLIDAHIDTNLKNSFTNLKSILNDAVRTEGEIPIGRGMNSKSISSEYKDATRNFNSAKTQQEKIADGKDLIHKFTAKIKVESLAEQMQKQSQEAKQELNNVRKLAEKGNSLLPNFPHVEMGDEPVNSNEVEKALKGVELSEAKENGKREVNFILGKMYGAAVPKEPAHILTNFPRELATPNPNQMVATQLAKMFDRIKETRKFKISESGSEIDIEALLQAKTKGYGEFMVDEIRSKGLTILVTIDGSGSMYYDNRMGKVRDLVATMFKSVVSIPQVKILANVWSADREGKVGITPVRTEAECNRINLAPKNVSSPYTPTHEALRYSAKELGKYSGKKLLIMITDGHPQYHKDGITLSEKVLVNQTIKEYRKAQNNCRNMMCINISPENTSKKNLKQIFKKNYVEFPGMEKASEFVLKNFRKTVNDTLRR